MPDGSWFRRRMNARGANAGSGQGKAGGGDLRLFMLAFGTAFLFFLILLD